MYAAAYQHLLIRGLFSIWGNAALRLQFPWYGTRFGPHSGVHKIPDISRRPCLVLARNIDDAALPAALQYIVRRFALSFHDHRDIDSLRGNLEVEP